MDRTGELLEGKYRLERLIGEGGMGVVYEARHLLINRRCAVKFLHPEIARNAEFVKRFVREAQAASAIGHKGIVDVYDVATAPDGTPYLVMEYLEGRSLASWLAGGRRLAPAHAAEIVAQALAALAVAHARGIVHRDLKPENLFVDEAPGRSPSVKILDFGICRMDLPGGPEGRLTRTGTTLGTPSYMAPEQAGGLKDIDRRLDLYAMGVILYECVTGRLPFAADNYNRLIAMILCEPFPRPAELDPAVPPALEAAILKAMARDRRDRFGSAEEMIAALVPLLSPKARARLDLPAEDAGAPPAPAGTAPGPAPQRTCPQCGRRFAESFQFCPVDAARLSGPPNPPAAPQPGPGTSLTPAPLGPMGSTLAPGAAPRPGLRSARWAAAAAIAVALAAVLTLFFAWPSERAGRSPPTAPAADGGPDASQGRATGLASTAAAAFPAPRRTVAPTTTPPAVAGPAAQGAPEVTPAVPAVPPAAGADAAPGADAPADATVTPPRLRDADGQGAAEARRTARADGRPQTDGQPRQRDAHPAVAPPGDATSPDAAHPSDVPAPAAPQSADIAPSPPAAAFIIVRAIPQSDVYLDGRYLGRSPLARTPAPAGVHHVRLVPVAVGAGKPERTVTVTIAPGETAQVVESW